MRKLICGLLTAAALFGADVTGTWSGPMEMTRAGEKRPDTAYLVLKQEGTQVTGTVGPNVDKRMTITKGSIDGDKLTLESAHPERDTKVVLLLKVDGDKITGDLKMEGPDSKPVTGTLSVTRVKE